MIFPQSDGFVRTRHDIIVASNRGPITFEFDEHSGLYFQRGSGGLVTALTGLSHQTKATWIASALTEADRYWGEGSLKLSADGETIRIKFISIDPEAYDQYYNVIANPLLWFIQHSMWDVVRAPVISKHTWHAWEDGYVGVNHQFAEALVNEVTSNPNPVLIMLQDYHLYLCARFIRDQLRRQRHPAISHFIHIPWPGPEYWGILPPGMRTAILDGLCAVDLLGFQTREDGLNFIRTCESYLPSARVRYKRGRVFYRNHQTVVLDFPISIDVTALRQLAASEEVAAYLEEMVHDIGSQQLILRIDRIEPSKNILRGFQAFEDLLEQYPEHREQVRFLALLVPSRMEVFEYRNYLDELMGLVGRINAKFGKGEWEPIRVIVSENYPRAIAALKLYDVLLVNSIADGMNLVAKEGPIVNEKDGVLILSERTGARQQLETAALVIAPCDTYATFEALHQALTMPSQHRKERAALLCQLVESEDIVNWLNQQLQTIIDLKL